MLKFENLKKKPREFLAATGLTVGEFEALLRVFGPQYSQRYSEETVEGKARQRSAGGGGKPNLDTMADQLLFILVYEKTYPLQSMLGLQFGLSQGRVKIWIHRLLPIVREPLASLKLTPERNGQALGQCALATEDGANVLIDGTERLHVRPVDNQEQSECYGGKKKAHTDKNLVIINCHSQKVVYLSQTQPGRKHDKKLADEAAIVYPSGAMLGKDTGFQGYELS
jgi:hypothetical protein